MTELHLPCGQCIGCRLDRSQQWAARCLHETKEHQQNCFITLTYDEFNLPHHGGLIKKDHQDFLKRLRKKIEPTKIKFYHCGEYGDEFKRPHYHTLIFGYDFPDRKKFKESNGIQLDTSETLDSIWGKGYCTVGDITYESAAYVARYVMKKINGKKAELINEKTGLREYERVHVHTGEVYTVLPEYNTMSRGGKKKGAKGIGASFYDKYRDDMYPHDYLIVDGRKLRPPRYYDNLFQLEDPETMEAIKESRLERMQELKHEYTPARLHQRELVTTAKVGQLKRTL